MYYDKLGRSAIAANYQVTSKEIKVLWEGEWKFYPLRETTEKEIRHRRLINKPTFILKMDDKFYLADIPYDFIRLTKNVDENAHLCFFCKHCKATIEELDGCSKVRDCSEAHYLKCGNSIIEALELSKRLEKYPFIRFGYETFGVRRDAEILSVDRCSNFAPYKKRGRFSIAKMEYLEEKMAIIKSLYDM